MHNNAAQAWLPIILASMAARGDPQCPYPQGTCDLPMVWWAWHECYPYVMAFSVTRSEPNRAFMGDSRMTPETAFSTSIKQVWVDWFPRGRMVPHPLCRIPDAAGPDAMAHTGRTGRTWWPNILFSDFTLVCPNFYPLPVDQLTECISLSFYDRITKLFPK